MKIVLGIAKFNVAHQNAQKKKPSLEEHDRRIKKKTQEQEEEEKKERQMADPVPQLTHYILKPVSSLTFLFVKLDANKQVISSSAPQNPDVLTYDGLYKFLFLIHKIDPNSFGTMFAPLKQLPEVDLTLGSNAPEHFRRQYPIETLRSKLKTFLKLWFEQSVDAQNIGRVNASVGKTPWPNKNMITPTLPKQVCMGVDGVTVVNAKQKQEQHDSIQALTRDLKALIDNLKECQSDSSKCGVALAQAGEVNTNLERLREVM